MEGVSFAIRCVDLGDSGAVVDAASIILENHSSTEANTNAEDGVSTFTTSGTITSCSKFHSTRIASMLSNRSEFESELEFRTAHSKVHWSELIRPEGVVSSEGVSSSEGLGVDHRLYFEKLQKDAHWGGFCSKVTNVVLGKKLGEGAQADIYEAQVTFVWDKGSLVPKGYDFVVKLMKGDCALEDLQRQWPHGVGSSNSEDLLMVLHGALVKEPGTKRNKFGFVMSRYWGDLRSLIDLRMEHKNAKGPPFSLLQAKCLMYGIAREMSFLHKRGIIHRDLKASNVLVFHYMEHCDIVSSNDHALIAPYVADWECSVGVVGTGWWRAPEILLQLKNGTPRSKLEFNEKVDVYSFAMTCYEIATGLTPLEGLPKCRGLRDAILNGTRPEFPHDLDSNVKAMITSCWNPNPLLRPSFGELNVILENFRLIV